MPSEADETSAVTTSTHGAAHVNGSSDSAVSAERASATNHSSQPAYTAPASTRQLPSPASAAPAIAAPAPRSDSSSSASTTSTASSPPGPFPSDAAVLSHLHSYLPSADLNVVTTKSIIAHLQSHFQHDLSSKKAIIKATINDFIDNPQKYPTSANGSDMHSQHDGGEREEEETETAADETEEDEPEQQAEETQEDIDHRLAMELAAENGRPRRSAAASSIKRAEKRKLKETKASNSSSTTAKKARKSNKPPTLYSLSPALSAFLPSNPSHASWGDVVKQLWAYFRTHQLQDERNKKRIVLDEALQSVFGRERKTMDAFKMNTLLTKHMKKQDDLA